MNSIFTVYVLQLKSGKYYVGLARNLGSRLRQHITGHKGSVWTWKYEIEKIVKRYYCDSRWAGEVENLITLLMIQKYGKENVRGGYWVNTKKYSSANKESIINDPQKIKKEIIRLKNEIFKYKVLKDPKKENFYFYDIREQEEEKLLKKLKHENYGQKEFLNKLKDLKFINEIQTQISTKIHSACAKTA